jgi:triacylglycerol lipase
MRRRLAGAWRSASRPSFVTSTDTIHERNATLRRSACLRHFGAYAPLCRDTAPTDARIKGLGREIDGEYAVLRDNYGMRPEDAKAVEVTCLMLLVRG